MEEKLPNFILVVTMSDGCTAQLHGSDYESGWSLLFLRGIALSCPHGIICELLPTNQEHIE